MQVTKSLARRYEIPMNEFKAQYGIVGFVDVFRLDTQDNNIVVETVEAYKEKEGDKK
jgi:hypothetical protein